MFMKFMTRYKWTRQLLLNYPGLFSFGVFRKEPPSHHHIQQCSFKSQFVGFGFKGKNILDEWRITRPDVEIVTSVTGPEVAYVTTPIAVVSAAYTLLEEKVMNE